MVMSGAGEARVRGAIRAAARRVNFMVENGSKERLCGLNLIDAGYVVVLDGLYLYIEL